MGLRSINDSSLSRIPNYSDISLKALNQIDSLNYLERLNGRLKNLALIFKNEDDEFIIPHIELLKNSLKGLYLKYQLPFEKKIDFDLMINPNLSGYPTLKDFIALKENKRDADEILGTIPQREEIIEIIRTGIMHGINVDSAQDMLRRLNFFSYLKEYQLFDEDVLPITRFIKKESKREFHVMSWGCVDWLWKVPVFYNMCFQQDSRYGSFDLGKKPVLKGLLLQTKSSHIDLKTLGQQIDSMVEEIHPKFIERFTLGPYYDNVTNNPEEIQRLINDESDPSVMKFIRERVLSERTKPFGGLLERIMGKKTEREVFSPTYEEMRMVVPFRIKQKLGNFDEKDNPCKVYGVRIDGGIVG